MLPVHSSQILAWQRLPGVDGQSIIKLEGLNELTARAVDGKKTIPISAIVFIEALSIFVSMAIVEAFFPRAMFDLAFL